MRYLIPILVLAIVAMPQSAAAQGIVACTGALDCNFCALAATVNNIVQWLVGFMVIVAVILLAYAGIRIASSAGDTARVEEGKKLFFNVVIGIVIVLAAWILVDTILKALVNTSQVNIGRVWTPVDCGGVLQPATGNLAYTETAIDQSGYVGTVNGVAVPAGDPSLAGGGMTDSIARSLFNTAGIELKDNVSLQGIQPHVIDQLIALDQSCNCNILVTSVTDGNHSTTGSFTHANGFKADLRTYDNPQLVNYVQSLPYSGSWSDGTRTYYDASSCATYAVEGDHIDVVYKTGC